MQQFKIDKTIEVNSKLDQLLEKIDQLINNKSEDVKEKKLYSIPEAAKHLDLTEYEIKKGIKNGTIKYKVFASNKKITSEELERLSK